MSTVALIIPCYRDAATLARALDSVRAQTRQLDEVIVVNDCSPETPAIEAVLARYPEVRYLRNQRNLGLAETRNVGVRATDCKIVSFLDADDELHPQKTEFQLLVYREGVAITCDVARIGDEVGLASVSPYKAEFKPRRYSNSRELLCQNRLTGAAMMIDRRTFLSVGGYDAELRSCEDFDLWLRILDAEILTLKILLPLYLYRVNPHGLSRNYSEISRWELEVLRRYFIRNNRNFPKNFRDAAVWAFWMVKHLLRCERTDEPALLARTRENISVLKGHPLIHSSLKCIDHFRLLKPIAWMLRMR